MSCDSCAIKNLIYTYAHHIDNGELQAVDGLPLQPIIGVRYYDRFRKVKGVWQFHERRIETRMAGDLSHHLLQAP